MRGRPSVKNCLKRSVKGGIMLTSRFLPGARRPGGRILTYHSVGTRAHEMNVTPLDFREQMTWLAAHAQTRTLAQIADGAVGVAITFDDGYRDNLVHAAPVLDELGIPATVFVVAGRVGGRLDHDAGLTDADLLAWDEIRQLRGGQIEIGAHTINHPRLVNLTLAQQRSEIVGSKERLERELGEAVDVFAYPFGSALDYNDDSKRLVRKAGFRLAVSNRYGVNGPDADRWALRRIWIDG